MWQLHQIQKPNRVHQFWPLATEVDRLFDTVFNGNSRNGNEWSVPLDLTENDQAIMVRLEMPGVRSEDLDIQIDQKKLTITGKKLDPYAPAPQPTNNEGEAQATVEEPAVKFHHRETRYGTFARSVTLPDGINTDGIKADYSNGVLVVTLPKVPVEPVKKIQVNVS
jgi:HSP20 family protein